MHEPPYKCSIALHTHTHTHTHTHPHTDTHTHTHTITTNTHTTYTHTHTNLQTHMHMCTHTHIHTVHMIGGEKEMIHLKVLFWLAILFLLWMWLTVAQSCNPQSQSCQLCTTQSHSGLPKESKYLIDLYTCTFQIFSPVIYPLNLPLC